MPIFRVNGKMIHFVHVPKCGGTSIENALLEHDIALGFINERWWRQKNKLWYKSSPQHISRDDLSTLFPEGFFDYEFAIIRDPVSRFISAFNHNRRARRIWPFSTLEAFVRKIEKRKDYFGWEMDNHFLPASRFLSETCEVFRLEDGTDPVSDRLLEISEGAIRLNIKRKNVRLLNDTTSETHFRKLVKAYLMPKIPSKENLMPETFQRIKALYREDYDLLNR